MPHWGQYAYFPFIQNIVLDVNWKGGLKTHLDSRIGTLEEYRASHLEGPKLRCKHKLDLINIVIKQWDDSEPKKAWGGK